MDATLPHAVPAPAVARHRASPPSFAQERLWVIQQLEGSSEAYHLFRAFAIRGPLSVDALEAAIGEVIRRHEALRTTFREEDGHPVAVVAPFDGFALAVEDMSAVPSAERAEAVQRRARDEAARPFDLAAGPLFRAVLLRTAADAHVLLLTVHHIVADGWSMGILYRELSAFYAEAAEGREAAVSALPVQYADYARWSRKRLQGPALERETAWWKARLAGAPALLELPLDRPRPAVQGIAGAAVSAPLDAELVDRLQALGRGEGATLFMVLLAAFDLLLAKYTGSDDIPVGTPVAGRMRAEVEGLIGFFANTLVLRADLSGNPTFREVMRRVRTATLGAYEHQEVPFEKLVAELAPERTLSHAPLFQVTFSMDAETRAELGLAGTDVAPLPVPHAVWRFDLSLLAAKEPEGWTLHAHYRTELFDRATIERVLAHLTRVLAQAAADPDVRLSDVELLAGDERRTVLDEWNRTAVDYPSRSIGSLFAEQAARTPAAVAVVHRDEAITCAELNARANRIARHLRRRGVGLESRVGLCVERGPAMVAAAIGILKAGGAYVPLDPGYPAERLAFMLADAGVQVLVTDEALRGSLPLSASLTVVSLDGDAADIAAERADDVDAGAGPRSLAYVIYTSGSTGTPKGVGVEHRSVVRLVRGANYVDLGPEQTVLQAAPVSFDASTLELWGPLLNGGRVALLPGSTPTLEELGATVRRHAVTTAWMTAGLFQAMADERIDDLGGLTQLLAGGDVLPVEQTTRVLRRFPHLRLINGYGPTENTTFTCCHTVPAEWRGGPIPIGSPISNTRVYVLDHALRPVPVGIAGELYAGGDGVARGYVGRPAATAERFVPDPFSPQPGARMYRTGDRARWRADGTVEYLGRLDAQVKVRGFRVEPGEIESVLRRHAHVTDCTVVARDDAPGGRRLVAYVVGDAEAEELRAAVRAALPEYMLPAAFVRLDRLPLTPNGKVDRRALPAPELGGDEEDFVAPRTEEEAAIAAIWREVLGVDRVGIHDGFFELGGHSLMATRVASRIRNAFGVELTIRALFEAPTVELLARVVAERRASAEATAGADESIDAASPQRLLQMLDGLSDDELDRLLASQS